MFTRFHSMLEKLSASETGINVKCKNVRSVVPNLFLVRDPFQIIIKLTDPYIFIIDPKEIIW